MKNKSLIIFIPSIEGGGVEKNLFIITNYLSKNINNISLITCDDYKERSNNINLVKPKSRFWKLQGRKLKYLICLILLIKQIIIKRDVVVFSFQANLYASLICKFLNQKIIIRANSSPSGWSNNFFKKIIFYWLFKLPDEIIVNSKEFRNELKFKFNVLSKYIYNPLDKKKIASLTKKNFLYNFLKKKKYFKIISIGRLVDQKDHLTLINAVVLLKKVLNFKLLIIGNGKNKEKLQKIINKNKLSKNIKIINFQKNPYKFIKICDLFVLSSKYEGLPNVLLESTFLKVPIISSDCKTGPKEILLGSKGGVFFQTGNSKDLARKILYSKNNYRIMKKKINYAFKFLHRFDEKKNLKKYLKLINYYLK